MWAGLSCFLSNGAGYVGELLELQQGCEEPFESSLGYVDFLELRQVLSTYDRDIRDPLSCHQERTVPMRVTRGPLGIPLPSIPGPKTLCGVGART